MKIFFVLGFVLLASGCGSSVYLSEIRDHLSVCDVNGGVEYLKLAKFSVTDHHTVEGVVCKNGASFYFDYDTRIEETKPE